MPANVDLTYNDLFNRARDSVRNISNANYPIYGVPRGGLHAMLIYKAVFPEWIIVDDPSEAGIIIDDIIDSGNTKRYWESKYPGRRFLALAHSSEFPPGSWVSFPWERLSNETGIEDNIRRIIQYIGDDPERDGLKETPARVAKSYKELYAGYGMNPAELLKEFDGEKYDEVILEKNIPFNSTCEHHMLPFSGVAHVAYLPNGPIIGASKMARIVDAFAARLQVQERLTQQIATTMMENITGVKGTACIIEAAHSCMSCRGVRKSGTSLVTSCMLGAFRDKPEARQELMSLIGR